MPDKVSNRRDSTSVSHKIDHRMKLYSAAAVASGVSMLALAQPAQGEVVITRKTIPIPVSSFFLPPPTPVLIDINHDGVNDFSFSLYSFAYHSFDISLTVRPLEGGAVVASPSPLGGFYASALARGAKIGPSAHFSSKGAADIERAQGLNASSRYSRRLYGDWGGNPTNRYVGVKFLINGETHYGWVRLTVTTQPRGFSATITGYAYETVANKKISAGIGSTSASQTQVQHQAEEPGRASLGMLAMGADALTLWRREKQAAS
jgi:hypothetical protein